MVDIQSCDLDARFSALLSNGLELLCVCLSVYHPIIRPIINNFINVIIVKVFHYA
jgi:hypothetical protein